MGEDLRSTRTGFGETTGRHALRDIPPVGEYRMEPSSGALPTQRTLVRPYVLTRGRTQSRRHLAIEALISTRTGASWNGARLTGEFRSVRSLCLHPRSVAEVAARLSVPLGVARVLLDDMAEQGLITIHDTRVNTEGRPAVALMERVLHGLRRL
ncbi:DUF742 domain-containing protein [Amycolatopsis sp. NPDC098790]|uniref:DUF742 domain-containing protein n=1 Tax=Amycolatopsis sp. NPDC098790 TaxID=3363939 RepID=UPI00382AED4C